MLKPSPASKPLIRLSKLGALGLELDQLAMELPAILVGDGGNMDHAPHLLLAVVPANEHRHQLDGVKAIRFGPALAPADFDRRGVDDDVLNPLMVEEAVNPEAIAAGFVARHHRGVRGRSESGAWPS